MISVLVILGMLLSFVIPNSVDRINRAKYERMINEMTSIAQASIDFYNAQYPKAWPKDISQLAPKFMCFAAIFSPWGEVYELSFQNNLVVVSTKIPAGIAQNNPEGPMLNVVTGVGGDQISLAQSIPNEGIGRVQYEKKYLYNQ